MMGVLPNFVYIGPDKAGSTWLFRLLSQHSDVFMTPAKDLYFFDRFYDRGLHWYAQQFDGGEGRRIVGEISHDYLYDPWAARRLCQDLSNVKLMVCLREPSERTFSAYLYLTRCGHFSGTFEEALESHPGLIHRSRYGQHLSAYMHHFPREQIYCAVFDDLRRDAQGFADQLFHALDLPCLTVPSKLQDKVLPAAKSRSVLITKTLRYLADRVRQWGMPKVVGRIKASPLMQRLLYCQYALDDMPTPSAATISRLREIFAADVRILDDVLGTDFCRRWSYQ
jgi:hypothetical protein